MRALRTNMDTDESGGRIAERLTTWIADRTRPQARALAAGIGSISAVLTTLALARLGTLLVTVTNTSE